MKLPEHPVIAGFHPDPTICCVEGRLYLATSSFEYSPGVPIFESTDLRTWRPVGHALTRSDQLDVEGTRSSGGVYAPTLRHHGGRFWLVTTDVSHGPGQLLMSADHAEGPWSATTSIPDAVGIDPDLAWDEAGACWLSWSGTSRAGRQAILQAQVDVATGALLSEPTEIWHGTGGQFPEGPHLVKREGWWYLVIAEGGTERGHMVTVSRGATPSGPFTASPLGPLLTARSTDQTVQNVGHADLVELPDGRWAAVFLGVRPRGSTPGWHVLGRETFAIDIVWEDGWPVAARPIEGDSGPVDEDMLAEETRHAWVAAAAQLSDVISFGDDDALIDPGGRQELFTGRRQEHFYVAVQARVESDAGVALEVRIDPWHLAGVELLDGVATAKVRFGAIEHALDSVAVPEHARLDVRTTPNAQQPGTPREAPDEVVLGVTVDGVFHELGRVDGRYVSTEVAGGFTGRMIGLRAVGGPFRLREFVYRGTDAAPANRK